jgi:hypothetical protein
MDEELVVSLARTAIEARAPHELPMFEAASREFVADPRRVERRAAPDDPLGFGAEVAGALTPVALAVAGEVVTVLWEQVRSALREESDSVVRAWVRKLFVRLRGPSEAEPSEPASLTPEQLAQVKAVALAKAASLGLPSEEGMLLADAMVGALATA